MKKLFLLLIFLLPTMITYAGPTEIALEKAPIHLNDADSIKRGAKFFSTVCMACHTMIYLRYDKLANEAGVKYERMPINVKSWPNGIKPPDLSLEADARGVDWIYTYLHSFYLDSKKPTGVNNLVNPDTAMPNVLAPFQGQQILDKKIRLDRGIYDRKAQWYDLLILQSQGTMTPDEFDKTMTDVVNFLAYAANPYEMVQHQLGWWVLGFLFLLWILLYFLKQSYWKDIKRKSE